MVAGAALAWEQDNVSPMIHKLMTVLIVMFWLGAMSWLVARDVWPAWTAQTPPLIKIADYLLQENNRAQSGIFDLHGRAGTIWTVYKPEEQRLVREDLIRIDRFALPIAPLTLTVESVFTADGVLDEFTARITRRGVNMTLHGERFHADFSFELDTGYGRRHTFKLPLSESALIASGFNPLSGLSNLHVGQAWRMQVFNPVSAVLGVGDRFIPLLVEVTGEETINTMDGPTVCLLVETNTGTRAWVSPDGIVYRQSAVLPVGGTLTIVRELFNESRYAKAHASARKDMRLPRPRKDRP